MEKMFYTKFGYKLFVYPNLVKLTSYTLPNIGKHQKLV